MEELKNVIFGKNTKIDSTYNIKVEVMEELQNINIVNLSGCENELIRYMDEIHMWEGCPDKNIECIQVTLDEIKDNSINEYE